MLTDEELVSECPQCRTRCEPDQIWTDDQDRDVRADYVCPCGNEWQVLTGALDLRMTAFTLDLTMFDVKPEPEPDFIDLGATT